MKRERKGSGWTLEGFQKSATGGSKNRTQRERTRRGDEKHDGGTKSRVEIDLLHLRGREGGGGWVGSRGRAGNRKGGTRAEATSLTHLAIANRRGSSRDMRH